ncbi:MAG: ADP-ribosylglycohydrolase family protein [Desulfobacterales bacterium]|nr:MAG: ADP-ribosylglycohydrolase family protein [Desulfobacterales bacterium]
MIVASLAADSLALGVHWIYDTSIIDEKFGCVENFKKPSEPTYHPTKDLGEFTHYGDQTLVLLESIAQRPGFDLDHFADTWRNFFEDYTGYFDGATKATLENFASGKGPGEAGSASDDLGGASRIGPLAYYYRNDLDQLVAKARAQTALTHNNEHVIESAEFFARVIWQVLQGEKPTSALQQVTRAGFDREPYSRWVAKGLESVELDTRQALARWGQMCKTEAAFPSVVHLIAKFEDDLKQGLVANVMAGGDSAARGLMVGLILGAYLGMDAIPDHWLSELKAYRRICDLLQTIDQRVTR